MVVLLAALALVGTPSSEALGAPPAGRVAQACVVPNVKGKSYPAAAAAISKAGCAVGTVIGVYSATVPKAHVVSVRPGPGKSLPRGSKVTVFVSRGPK